MNNSQRTQLRNYKKTIDECSSQMQEAINMLADEPKIAEDLNETQIPDIVSKLESVKSDILEISEEEQSKYDNMPEAFQQSDNGERMQNAAEQLNEAVDILGRVIDTLEEPLGEDDLAERLQSVIDDEIPDVMSFIDDAM